MKRVNNTKAETQHDAPGALRSALPYSAKDIFEYALTDPGFARTKEYLKGLNKLALATEEKDDA